MVKFAFGALVVVACVVWNGDAPAACKESLLSRNSVTAFRDHPQSFLSRYPTGGPALAAFTRGAAVYDRDALRALRKSVPYANVLQKRSIGRGLEQAVVACLQRDGEVAKEIADVIKEVADSDVIQGYLAATDDDAPIASGPQIDKRGALAPRIGGDLRLPSTATPPLVEPDRLNAN